jgi:hypothetical protein
MDAAEVPAENRHSASRPAASAGLTDRERQILAFERQWWAHAGAKEKAIREEFEVSATRYYQLLNELLEKRAALEADPMLVKRLRRLRTGRQRARAAKRLGIERR